MYPILRALSIIAGAYFCIHLGYVIYLDAYRGPQLAREFGFRLDSPMVDLGPDKGWWEVCQVSYVKLGGPLYESGFREDDILADLHGYQFYRLVDRAFHHNEPQTVTVLRKMHDGHTDEFVPVELEFSTPPDAAEPDGERSP